jgi:predicted RNA-binding protein associated with RNAse of E/G family
MSSNKQMLKSNLIEIRDSNYDLISLYRKSIRNNNKLQLYISPELYRNYEENVYSILDEYLYGEAESQEIVKNHFYDTIKIIINNL